MTCFFQLHSSVLEYDRISAMLDFGRFHFRKKMETGGFEDYGVCS